MKQAWQRYLAWFATLKAREQKIVALAILVGGLFLGYTYGVEPSMLAAKRSTKAAMEATAATATLVQQVAMLKDSNRDPDAALRTRRDELRVELGKQGSRFQAVERSLVPASQVSGLLESMVARSPSIQLLSMRTLAPEPVLEHKTAKVDGKPTTGKPAADSPAVADPGPNLFRHGVEIQLLGTYQDLTAYVTALESAPQRLLWGHMELAAKEYPKSQLTLTVYTLSLDKSWLIL